MKKLVGIVLSILLAFFILMVMLSIPYSVYLDAEITKKMKPTCDVAGGKLIKTYDGDYVCIRPLNLEK